MSDEPRIADEEIDRRLTALEAGRPSYTKRVMTGRLVSPETDAYEDERDALRAALRAIRATWICLGCGAKCDTDERATEPCPTAHREHWPHEWVTQRVLDLTEKAARLIAAEKLLESKDRALKELQRALWAMANHHDACSAAATQPGWITTVQYDLGLPLPPDPRDELVEAEQALQQVEHPSARQAFALMEVRAAIGKTTPLGPRTVHVEMVEIQDPATGERRFERRDPRDGALAKAEKALTAAAYPLLPGEKGPDVEQIRDAIAAVRAARGGR